MRLRLLLVALLVVAGCNRDGGFAAKVGPDTITAAAMDRDLADIAKNERFVKSRAERGVAFHGTTRGSYDAGIVAELLNRKITATLVHQEVVRRRLRVTAADRSAAERSLREQVVDVNGDALLDGFPRRYVAAQIETQAESSVLQADESKPTADPAAYPGLLRKLRSNAAVTVSPRFGTWDRTDPEQIRLVPVGRT